MTERSDQEQLVYGTDAGEVIMLLTGQRALPPKLLNNDAHNKDYEVLHAEHHDWVTQVCLIAHASSPVHVSHPFACPRQHSTQEQLVYGNDAGGVIMLLTGPSKHCRPSLSTLMLTTRTMRFCLQSITTG